jgi:hypothetical protein
MTHSPDIARQLQEDWTAVRGLIATLAVPVDTAPADGEDPKE